jgi:hypothetical protein
MSAPSIRLLALDEWLREVIHPTIEGVCEEFNVERPQAIETLESLLPVADDALMSHLISCLVPHYMQLGREAFGAQPP